jgi:hypothetical protein
LISVWLHLFIFSLALNQELAELQEKMQQEVDAQALTLQGGSV